MKMLYFFTLLFVSQITIFAQPLAFDQLGSHPAYCRLYNYQSGNGVVYASATGGTPPYTYLWEKLGTGSSTTNGTWGGLNVGDYKITITDDIGAFVIDTITLDSLNPVAAIGVIASGLTQAGNHFYGTAPVQIEFENNSLYFANPYDPVSDTTFFWKMTQFSAWYISHDLSSQTYDYNYGGNWGVYLVALNKNGCSDTAVVRLHLNGPLGVDENAVSQFTVSFNSTLHQVLVQSPQPLNGEIIHIYNLSGQLVHSEILSGNQTNLKMNVAEGVYVYEIMNPDSGTCFETGKFAVY